MIGLITNGGLIFVPVLLGLGPTGAGARVLDTRVGLVNLDRGDLAFHGIDLAVDEVDLILHEIIQIVVGVQILEVTHRVLHIGGGKGEGVVLDILF